MDQFTPPNILFYSKECPHCKKFAEILFKLPQVNDKFIKISVDDRRMRLPSFVQRVPTIVVFEQGQKNVLTDSKVFGWINQFLEDASKIDLVAYDQGAMSSSLSDGFSFIGDDAGKEAEHTFGWMDKLEDCRIGLVAENGNGPTTNSQNSKVTDGAMERYMSERDMGIPQIQKPTQNIDFTKLYEQDQGSARADQAVVSQLQNFRSRQVRRGPPPREGPNFQSGSFSADWTGQSNRGGIVRKFGGSQSQMNPKQRDMDNRMNQIINQRDRDQNSFQQRQQGEYLPLNINQPRYPQSQQSQHPSQMGRRPPQGMGRIPPPGMSRQRIV